MDLRSEVARLEALGRALDRWCESYERLQAAHPQARGFARILREHASACSMLMYEWQSIQRVALADKEATHGRSE